jgi:hypothetical protein
MIRSPIASSAKAVGAATDFQSMRLSSVPMSRHQSRARDPATRLARRSVRCRRHRLPFGPRYRHTRLSAATATGNSPDMQYGSPAGTGLCRARRRTRDARCAPRLEDPGDQHDDHDDREDRSDADVHAALLDMVSVLPAADTRRGAVPTVRAGWDDLE